MTIEWFKLNGLDLIPGDGLLPAMVPAVVGTWTEALARFGTMSFAQVLRPALELAEEGFTMYPDLKASLDGNAERFRREYPATAELYLPEGRVPENGELVGNPGLAGVLRRMMEAEKHSQAGGRDGKLRSACDEFYGGETAAMIGDFVSRTEVRDGTDRPNKGFLTLRDLKAWKARVEEPVTAGYRGLTVAKCPPWTQGPVFLQQLALLEGFDLRAMGHNTPSYVHTVIEAGKLAFADREAWYGDPDFDKVPLDALLSREYNDARRALIGDSASAELRPGCPEGQKSAAIRDLGDIAADNRGSPEHAHDTTHCDAIDRWGNMVSATPSGGWIQSSPVIKAAGFPLGTRGQMFYLNKGRPNALAPGKRPRTTLTPSLVLKDGKPYMVFGTPGGDQQDQWTLQFFLNVVDFGMNLQEAVDAPTFHTSHMPSSFYPRGRENNTMVVEERIPPETRSALEKKGHIVKASGPWDHGRVMGVRINPDGVIEGAASPRSGVAYSIGW
jgi:gamma-glutamyltranspeptidase/glutathione hydrolase